ncbi:MAG TPA: type IV secretion system DNA-binding domain-containing protein [Candidatus Paceibacterota bacterium]|nr:type IV secretion system DNA-binding domain-containing protein [Candidatus Pacearchaeota archaeon]HPC30520.1 type IV secretion system DNA-binding domain-containing protein [Candidatus Pacearchaeota archaeon]HRR94655.1 type IV secretion system DNA-binding domain-containing protein [Candidatus Paceibacterota bacterium]HRU20843.1 type IV secretion system DNA-binding domain-containing protein [Candidatus Paceibacterota bacterium]
MEFDKNKDITFFGKTTFRGEQRKFGIKTDDKRRHIYIIGKTGMGKTELLKNMVVQDIRRGNGVGFVDPHGEAAEELLNFVPQERIKDVVYFNPADMEYPIAFNIMEDVDVEYRHLVAGGLMAVFKKIWPDVWSSRMEYILNNTILALLEVPSSTLLGINRMLADAEWRGDIVERLQDPVVKAFWTKEFARYTQRYEVEATAAIQNKIGQFTSAPLIRNIIGQTSSTINMRKIMDEKKIFIVNLSKGRIGEEASRLLGALLITKLQLAAMSRVDIPEAARNDFNLYIDEFQNFSTESFATILSEARKYRLSLILAHQYITQMEEKVRDAVFGNVGTLLVFRVGADDAEFLEREFAPEFTAQDLVNLPKQNILVKLAIDGVTSRPFSAETLSPVTPIDASYREQIVNFSRENYGINREIVEQEIAGSIQTENNNLTNFSIPVKEKESSIELYDIECYNCGRKIKVPFKPDPKRPVYCKPCLKKIGSKDNVEFVSLEKSAQNFVPPEKKIYNYSKEDMEDKDINKKAVVKKNNKIDYAGLQEVLREAKQKLNKNTPQNNSQGAIEDNFKNSSISQPDSADSLSIKRGKINPGETIQF